MHAQSDKDFIEKVMTQGELRYRELPWRYISDPYGVLVSEVMLQQTQVVRVLKYWERFMKLFPTLDALAAADTATVLEMWQGLGYNRRALLLKKAAEACARENAGELPRAYEELIALPGIGKATAAGVRIFAFQEFEVYLETNVRSVFLYEYFSDQHEVRDSQIVPLVERVHPEEDPQKWYYALLDYGAHLKKTIPNPSRKSAHHAKQSQFEGSRRQKRAELVRLVLAHAPVSHDDLHELLNSHEMAQMRSAIPPEEFRSLVNDLIGEGFFKKEENFYCI